MPSLIWQETALSPSPLPPSVLSILLERARSGGYVETVAAIAGRPDLPCELRRDIVEHDAAAELVAAELLLCPDLTADEVAQVMGSLTLPALRDAVTNTRNPAVLEVVLARNIAKPSAVKSRTLSAALLKNPVLPIESLATLLSTGSPEDRASARTHLRQLRVLSSTDQAQLIDAVAEPFEVLSNLADVSPAAVIAWVDRLGGSDAVAAALCADPSSACTAATFMYAATAGSHRVEDSYVDLVKAVAVAVRDRGRSAGGGSPSDPDLVSALRVLDNASTSTSPSGRRVSIAAAEIMDVARTATDPAVLDEVMESLMELDGVNEAEVSMLVALNPASSPEAVRRAAGWMEPDDLRSLAASDIPVERLAWALDDSDLPLHDVTFAAPLVDVVDALVAADAITMESWAEVLLREDVTVELLERTPVSMVVDVGVGATAFGLLAERLSSAPGCWDLFETFAADADAEVTVGDVLSMALLAANTAELSRV